MNALEIVLLAAGIICIVVSFFIDTGKEKDLKEAEIDIALDERQKEHVRNEVDAIIERQLDDVSDRTEAELEKLSSTKIMEFGEYADTVFEEINRNHNEVMFLYDMLSEKSKDVKTTVRTINVTKKQVEKLQQEKAEGQTDAEPVKSDTKKPASKTTAKSTTRTRTTKAAAKVPEAEDTVNQEQTAVKEEEKPAPKKRGRRKKEEVPRNQRILDMYNQGSDVKTIAREMGIGVGEVSLIIGLNKL